MYVDIVISNAFNLNNFFLFLCKLECSTPRTMMDEPRRLLGLVELWYIRTATHQTNNDASSSEPCTTYTVQHSGISVGQLTKRTMMRVRLNLVQHTQSSNVTTMTQRQEILVSASIATERICRLRSWRWMLAADLHTGEQHVMIRRAIV